MQEPQKRESAADRFLRETQENINAHAEVVTSYELEELIYNLRETHQSLDVMNRTMNEAKAKKAELDLKIAALTKILDEMQANNINNLLEPDIKKIQEQINSLQYEKGLCDTRCCLAGGNINDKNPWYRTVVALLGKPDYAKKAKKKGIILKEYDSSDVIKHDPEKEALSEQVASEQQVEASSNGVKKESPIPRHLMAIANGSDQKKGTDNPSQDDKKQISP